MATVYIIQVLIITAWPFACLTGVLSAEGQRVDSSQRWTGNRCECRWINELIELVKRVPERTRELRKSRLQPVNRTACTAFILIRMFNRSLNSATVIGTIVRLTRSDVIGQREVWRQWSVESYVITTVAVSSLWRWRSDDVIGVMAVDNWCSGRADSCSWRRQHISSAAAAAAAKLNTDRHAAASMLTVWLWQLLKTSRTRHQTLIGHIFRHDSLLRKDGG